MKVRLVMGALLFAMVLLGSVVVVAAYPTGYYLEQTGTGFAYLSTEQYYSYNTAVKMGTIVGSDRGAIVFSGGPQLSEIYALSYWTYTHQAGTFGQLTAWVAIYLHTEPGKTFAEWVTDYLAGSPNVYYIQAEPYYAKSANPQLDNWEKWDAFDATYPLKWVGLESPDYPHEAPTLADYISGDAVNFLTPYHGYQSFASREYGTLYIVAIKIRVGYGGPWVNTLVYVDDVIINDYYEDFTIKVSIDIKPGSYPNSINLKSKGVVPVAALTTEYFDASTVNPATVCFAGAWPVRYVMEDVDNDGDIDMLFFFRTQDLTALTPISTTATLSGLTTGGFYFEGTDSVNIVP